MKPFPGVIEVVGHHQRMVLNDEQKAWLNKWFPVTENRRLCKEMKVSKYKLSEFVRELDLHKSEVGMKAIKRRQVKAIMKANLRNGCYDRKRGHPPSEATLEAVRKRWQDVRAGLRESPAEILKRTNPEKYKAWLEKRSQYRRESIRKEKMRIIYGLKRKTRLNFLALCPYKRSQIHHRHNALKRGYLLDEDCSEGSPGRYVIYYDDETQRSEKFEQNCMNDGFEIKRSEL